MYFLLINRTWSFHNLKTKGVMSAKISVFVICVKAIMYLLLTICTTVPLKAFSFLTMFFYRLWMNQLHAFFFKRNIFISNARIKLAKHWAELLLFENYSLSSSTFKSKNNRRYFKKFTKNKCASFNDVIWLMKMKMRLKMQKKIKKIRHK